MVILTQGWAFIGSYKVTADSNQGYYIPVTWFVTSIRNSYFEQKFGHYTCCTSKNPALTFKPTTSGSKAFFHYNYLDQVVSHSKDDDLSKGCFNAAVLVALTQQCGLIPVRFDTLKSNLNKLYYASAKCLLQ